MLSDLDQNTKLILALIFSLVAILICKICRRKKKDDSIPVKGLTDEEAEENIFNMMKLLYPRKKRGKSLLMNTKIYDLYDKTKALSPEE